MMANRWERARRLAVGIAGGVLGLGFAIGVVVGAGASAIARTDDPPVVKPRVRPAPDVRGRDEATAGRLLRAASLGMAPGSFPIAQAHWKDSLDPQRIALQVPKPGDPVVSGQVVGVWRVVKAPADAKPVASPDLRGLTRDQASAKLKEAGLTLMAAEGIEPTKEGAGRVEAQYPRARQMVLPGTSVFVRFGATAS